ALISTGRDRSSAGKGGPLGYLAPRGRRGGAGRDRPRCPPPVTGGWLSATQTGLAGFSLVMDELCRRLAADLDGAFPDLVDALASDVYSGLRRLAGADDAEDLTQETFIRAYRALGEYDAERIRNLRLRAWVWTIALNLG